MELLGGFFFPPLVFVGFLGGDVCLLFDLRFLYFFALITLFGSVDIFESRLMLQKGSPFL